MLQLTPSTASPSFIPYNAKRHLAQLRRIAKRRGFRVLKDWTGSWSLVDIKVEPPHALIGLWQVSLDEIDLALTTPLPASKARVRKPKPVKPVAVLQSAPEVIDAEFEPFEQAPVEPLSAVEVLQDQFDVAAILEKLRMFKARGR